MKLELGLWAGARHGDEDQGEDYQGEDLDGDEGGMVALYVECNWSQQDCQEPQGPTMKQKKSQVAQQSFSESITVEDSEELTMEKLSLALQWN